MCGRMALTMPHEAMVQMFDAVPSNTLADVPNYNICPTNQIHTVTADAGRRALRPMRWGFVPRWYKAPNDGPLLINARAETIAQKPAFGDAARKRRCLIIATGFYEWTVAAPKTRLPWYITRADKQPLVFAGIWQDFEQEPSCAIVTIAANKSMGQIHHRMPVVLPPDGWALWLGEAGHGAAALMRAAPEEALGFHRVDRAVNSNRAAGPELIEPWFAPESGPD